MSIEITNWDEIETNQNEIKWEIIKATMNDIYQIIMAINKEWIPAENDLEAWRLREQYLHNRTVNWEFEYDSHYRWTRLIGKIKQHKPKPQKAPYHFVVEM